jgi:membrane fusion protein
MVMFLFVAPYARKETVAGFLLPTAGIARVHVPRPGIISGVHVREGQEVEEGQPLLSIASGRWPVPACRAILGWRPMVRL